MPFLYRFALAALHTHNNPAVKVDHYNLAPSVYFKYRTWLSLPPSSFVLSVSNHLVWYIPTIHFYCTIPFPFTYADVDESLELVLLYNNNESKKRYKSNKRGKVLSSYDLLFILDLMGEREMQPRVSAVDQKLAQKHSSRLSIMTVNWLLSIVKMRLVV